MPPRFVAFRQPETVGRCRWPPVRLSWPAAFLGSSVADRRSRPSSAVGNAGVLDLALFVPRTPINTDSSAVGCRRAVPTEWDAGLPRHNVILRRLVSTRQGRARTLGNGLLGVPLLRDRDGVGGDHGGLAGFLDHLMTSRPRSARERRSSPS